MIKGNYVALAFGVRARLRRFGCGGRWSPKLDFAARCRDAYPKRRSRARALQTGDNSITLIRIGICATRAYEESKIPLAHALLFPPPLGIDAGLADLAPDLSRALRADEDTLGDPA